MSKVNFFLILVVIFLFALPLLAFANTDSTINHEEEIFKLKRQLTAEHYLKILTELINKKEAFKEQLSSVTGFKGPYEPEKFKLSDEYVVYRLFVFPFKPESTSNSRTIYQLESSIKERIKSLKFETLDDALKTEFVQKKWARIIFYDGKAVGYMLIDWDKNYNNYIISESTMGYNRLGEAIKYMKEFLKSKGQTPNVKIVDALERSLYVVSEDGNWWCTDAADSSNPEMYRKQIWNFKDIKDALNNRPKEFLNYVEELNMLMIK